jgi:hypothetical protein
MQIDSVHIPQEQRILLFPPILVNKLEMLLKCKLVLHQTLQGGLSLNKGIVIAAKAMDQEAEMGSR